MLKTLQDEWKKDGVMFEAEKQHQRCMAHIINLGVNAALKKHKMSDEELEASDRQLDLEISEDEDEDLNPPLLLETMDTRNVIEKVNDNCYEFITSFLLEQIFYSCVILSKQSTSLSKKRKLWRRR